jgi:two-component sensor histidine kinase
MARSYELLSSRQWKHTAIADILRSQLAPFGGERVGMDGPDLPIGPSQALALGMAIHELATNSAKYGALMAAEGRVQLRWSEDRAAGGSEVVITWSESGGPPVAAPPKHGFGLTLVEGEISYSLGGSVTFDFLPGGLRVVLRFPPDFKGAGDGNG